MARLRRYIVPILLTLALGVLAGADAECDWEDGEFEFDLPSWHHSDEHDGYYYEEYYYTPCPFCWW